MAAPMAMQLASTVAYSHRILWLSRCTGVIHSASTSYHCGPCITRTSLSHCTTQAGQLQGDQPGVFKHFDWMSKKAPRFSVCGDKITVLKGPAEYFETLKERLEKCQRRVVLAALYLGTGRQEDELVNSLYDACRRGHLTNPSTPLEVQILLDCTRGSRGRHNSRTMLLPLLKDFPSDVQVSLYHTPDLRGVLKKMIPERFNEVIGLSHLKVCIFDDTLIITGANLSESYFTNRQDRYVMLEDCPRVADFFSELVSTVSSFSFQLNPDGTLTLDPEVNIHPYEGDEQKFKETAREKIKGVLDPRRWKQFARHSDKLRLNHQHQDLRYDHCKVKRRKHRNPGDKITTRESLRTMHKDVTSLADNMKTSDENNLIDTNNLKDSEPSHMENETEIRTNCNILANAKSAVRTSEIQHRLISEPSHADRCKTDDGGDTLIFPLVQMGSFGVADDQEVTGQLLRSMEAGSHCVLASGYFNLTKEYMDLVLGSRAVYDILMASPQANGFYGAKGISGYVPAAYTFIARNFWRKVRRQSQEKRISMYEYYRRGWTFHVKGLWYYLRGQSLPSLTLIGSPNFGQRSVHRDLEAQIAIVTTNEKLRMQLHQEQQQFFQQSEPVKTLTFKREDRRVPLWAKIFTIVTRNFF